ncbi:class I SAM-dependent methyltransferase [Candidatus Woesearchaeota archaeon]|nr:class I SAM-dependent methyltransferase [Candidatus Woesearchaeota archaeon]MBW3021705.1 class I SAM-dependent methyltransferase [Candidatus Woesearchaeota archaeon]
MIGRDPVYEAREKLLLKSLSMYKEGRFLDVGCNRGDTCQKVHELGFDVVGIDVDKKILIEAKNRFPKIKFVEHDLTRKLPFADSSFDYVWAGDIIEHLVNTKFFLRELNRVLKSGGTLFLSTPYHGIIKNLSIAVFNFNKHYHPEHEHVRFYTKKTLVNQLNENGFSVIKVSLIGRVFPLAKNMFVIARKTR